jgi:hypothetical protein
MWHDNRVNWFERECIATQWDENTQKAKKSEGESDDLLQSVLGANFNAHCNADRLTLTPQDMRDMEGRDDYYQNLAAGDIMLGQAPRADIASDDDMVDPELGYVPDTTDYEWEALNQEFNELF